MDTTLQSSRLPHQAAFAQAAERTFRFREIRRDGHILVVQWTENQGQNESNAILLLTIYMKTIMLI